MKHNDFRKQKATYFVEQDEILLTGYCTKFVQSPVSNIISFSYYQSDLDVSLSIGERAVEMLNILLCAYVSKNTEQEGHLFITESQTV